MVDRETDLVLTVYDQPERSWNDLLGKAFQARRSLPGFVFLSYLWVPYPNARSEVGPWNGVCQIIWATLDQQATKARQILGPYADSHGFVCVVPRCQDDLEGMFVLGVRERRVAGLTSILEHHYRELALLDRLHQHGQAMVQIALGKAEYDRRASD